MPVNGSLRPDIAVRIGERLRPRLITPPPPKPFWVDTMRVDEETERIAFVDNPGKWPIEGRVLERLDTGTAVRFAGS